MSGRELQVHCTYHLSQVQGIIWLLTTLIVICLTLFFQGACRSLVDGPHWSINTQIGVTYHVSLDVTPQFRLQTQCNYTSNRTECHSSSHLGNFYNFFFQTDITFDGHGQRNTQNQGIHHVLLPVTPQYMLQGRLTFLPEDRGSQLLTGARFFQNFFAKWYNFSW